MSIIKKPYELSVWEDVLIYVGKDSNGEDIESSNINDLAIIDYQYYTENRLAIIGSDTMTDPGRAHNVIFKKNINGTQIVTFDMFYQYENFETGEIIRNPLINLVVDERKIKLFYEKQWYDFIVKKDDEKGRDYKYSYTCTGLAANELGKTGFNIELDVELENNIGTIQQLGEAVLSGSDWQLASEGQEVIQQTNNEALYSIILTSPLNNIKQLDETTPIYQEETFTTIPSGARIYVYYTPYATQEKDYFQFIYVYNDTGMENPDLLEDNITINCNNSRTYDLYISNVEWENEKPSFAIGTPVVAQYRGERYVRKQLSSYDPVLERTVLKYIRDEIEYYGYTTTKYIDTTTVQNYIYNSTNFSGTSYWGIYGESTLKFIQARVFPNVQIDNIGMERAGYLVVNFGNSLETRLVNEGIIQNYSRINKFDKGEKYRFRISIGTVSGQDFTFLTTLPFKIQVKKYLKIDQDSAEDIIYFDSNNLTPQIENNYIIIDMECLHSATWRELKDAVGIFLIPTAQTSIDYYIKDIQFYNYVVGKNDIIIAPNDPIENLPDVRIETENHFYNPSENLGKLTEEDYIFSESDPSLYTPLYGSGENKFEKVRSISAKESNRFNLLQELSEIFECWVRFNIDHELDGTIKIEDFDYYNLVNIPEGESTNNYYIYDWNNRKYVSPVEEQAIKGQKYYEKVSRKRQVKKVTFYKEILIDNYAGFKYGINLKDNNRTLDSEQIVTKIIVKNNNCDQAENGFCSIARAKDNPIKENFVYNFDYYTSQGIINTNTLNNDLYLEINGSIGLYPKLSRLNKERNELIDSAAPLANSIDNLNSRYQVAILEYNAAEKELQRMKDPKSGTIYQYTHYIYEDFYNQYTRTENHLNVPAYNNEIYYINVAGVTNITSDDGELVFYQATNDTEPQSGKTYYYMSSGRFTQLNSTKFRNTSIYYEEVSESYEAGTYFQTSDEVSQLSFIGDGNPEIYIYNAARRRIQDLGAEDFINDNFTISTLEKIVTQENNKINAKKELDQVKPDLEETQQKYDAIQDQLKNIANATNEIEKEFIVKYSRYIQEGSWTDDNYMDDDLYYLDSLSVLYQSAYPKVSYNFSVIDISALEEYELYKFDIGYKTYVEDTEFFGYQIIDTLRTPVKEQVVVTEATIYLDENDKNELKVQNYKSHFEDLFQRITAVTQNLEYHSGEYNRAANAITATGEISQSVMQKSLATSSYVISNAKDQSVSWDETGLQAVNLNDPAQITRLASTGILISADGGQTWGVAISGYGINTNYLSAGIIDADRINIMSGAWPTFKWDSLGLRAYGFTSDGQGNILSYDPSRYVAHDRFGIYGINGLTDANFQNIQDIKDNATFGLTWDGLFIKSTHRDGYVSIDSQEDITLNEYYTSNGERLERIRGKFGLLSDGDTNTLGQDIYGLALYDSNGQSTVETKSNGTLWLKSQMDIGDSSTNEIYIGVGKQATEAEVLKYGANHGKKVFTVHGASYTDETGASGGNTTIDRFSVYEDGFIVSRGSYISGPINITEGGQIGNMTVAGLVDTVGVRIVPGNTEFKYNNNEATPSSMTFTVTHGFEGTPTYQWYLWKNASEIDNHSIANAQSNSYTYIFSDSDFQNGIAYLKVKVSINGQNYTDRITLSYVSDGDGTPGEDGVVYTYYIDSSLGDVINISNLPIGAIQTQLTGHIYKTQGNGAPTEITNSVNNWEWHQIDENGNDTIIQGVTTSSFGYNLASWNRVQIYFIANVNS